MTTTPPDTLSQALFQAAVERPFSATFRRPDGKWEGHDYRVEVITERRGLDAFDVVVDFRELEEVLDALLVPLDGQLLSDLGIPNSWALARRIFQDLAPHVPSPAYLAEVALTDGQGSRIAVKA